jgi:hypothetical protein
LLIASDGFVILAIEDAGGPTAEVKVQYLYHHQKGLIIRKTVADCLIVEDPLKNRQL